MAWRLEGRIAYLVAILVIYTVYLSYKVYLLESTLDRIVLAHPNLLHSPNTPIVTKSRTIADKAYESSIFVNQIGEDLSLRSSKHMNKESGIVSIQTIHHEKSPSPKVSPRLEASKTRDIYGGVVDMAHLGGFTEQDNNTISHNAWNFLMSELAVKSMIDVGCGRGFSSKYFLDRGVDVVCVEGSHDAIDRSFLPRSRIVQHDFTLGGWWPDQTYDLAWSTEFLEHVGRQYMDHYLPIFMKSALVMVTTSGWGGWHHVEVHAPWWWIARFEARGFVFSRHLTELMQSQVKIDQLRLHQGSQLMGIMVFINPVVASLPRHKHLIGGKGCYKGAVDNEDGGAECPGVDALPEEYKSLVSCKRPNLNEPLSTAPWVCD